MLRGVLDRFSMRYALKRGPQWTTVLLEGLLFRFHVRLGKCKVLFHIYS